MTPLPKPTKALITQELTNKKILDSYKRLNLVQVAKDLYGYKIDTKGSHSQNDSNLEPVYKHYTNLKMYQSAFGGTDDKQTNVILVRKNISGEYFYTNVTAPRDQGTIIEFIANRNQLDIRNKEDLAKILTIISSYNGDPISLEPLPVYVPFEQEPKERNAQVARYFKLLPAFNSPEYLLSRGIEKSTLDADEFKGRICNNVIKDRKGNQHVNIAFPIVDKEDNLCGIEYKNITLSGLQADSDSILWRSNLVNPDIPVEGFVIGENAIDVISYAQIQKLIGKNFLLLTHAGALHKPQINAIQYLIDLHAPKKLILAEDKDTEGYRNDIMLMGALNRPFEGKVHFENDFKAGINITDKVKATLILSFAFSNINDGETLVNQIIADFTKHNHDPLQPVFKAGPENVTYGNYTAGISIEFHVSELNMQKVLEIVTKHRGMSDFIAIDKPEGANLDGNKITDWNEFLMTKKEIRKDDMPALMYKYKNTNVAENNILKSNAFKPSELVQLFIENWDKGIAEVQEDAVNAGVNIDVISYLIAKHQLIAFNNFTEAVQRVFDLDFVGYKEFENFKNFIADNEDKFKEIVFNKKSDLQSLENELMMVKKQLRIEGDELEIDDYQKLMEEKTALENSVKLGKKSLGTHNEYLDAKYYNELTEIVLAKAKKVWDKTVRESMDNFQNDADISKKAGIKHNHKKIDFNKFSLML
jgi:hypothetical protein